MSFFKKLKEGEDTDFSEEKALEEQYQKMYKKIARDFVHKDDLKEILLEIIEEAGLTVEVERLPIKAYLKHKEYEKNMDSSLTRRKTFLDIDEYPFILIRGVEDGDW